MDPNKLDLVVDRIQLDLLNADPPDPQDVLLWALERFPDGHSYPVDEVAIWFDRDFRPVVQASLG